MLSSDRCEYGAARSQENTCVSMAEETLVCRQGRGTELESGRTKRKPLSLKDLWVWSNTRMKLTYLVFEVLLCSHSVLLGVDDVINESKTIGRVRQMGWADQWTAHVISLFGDVFVNEKPWEGEP